MKDFDHLLSVWQEQPKRVKLSVEEVLKQVKKGLTKIKGKVLWSMSAGLILLVVIICIVLFMPIKNMLTYLGLGIWIIGLLILSAMQIGNYRLLASLDITSDPATYLSHLKLYRKRKAYMNGRFFYYYALTISIGLMLYLDEFIHHSSIAFKTVFYVGWLAYLIFVIFYLKKRLIARENRRVAELIGRLENIKQQFE